MDVGPHMIDALRWLVGEVDAVVGVTQIDVPYRPAVVGGAAVAPVTADDAVSFLLRMRGGQPARCNSAKSRTDAMDSAVSRSRGTLARFR